jgi:hypothetical protein
MDIDELETRYDDQEFLLILADWMEDQPSVLIPFGRRYTEEICEAVRMVGRGECHIYRDTREPDDSDVAFDLFHNVPGMAGWLIDEETCLVRMRDNESWARTTSDMKDREDYLSHAEYYRHISNYAGMRRTSAQSVKKLLTRLATEIKAESV